MKTIGVAVMVTATLLLAAPRAGAEDKDKDKDALAKRTIHRLEKSANNTTEEKIKVKVGDTVEIEWTYPVVPGAIPSGASGKSDADAVKFVEVDRVVIPKRVGAGRLVAVFKAEKEGKATLTFEIKSKAKGGEDTGATVKCEVEVAK
jgi:hypothetical protein